MEKSLLIFSLAVFNCYYRHLDKKKPKAVFRFFFFFPNVHLNKAFLLLLHPGKPSIQTMVQQKQRVLPLPNIKVFGRTTVLRLRQTGMSPV